MCRSKSPAVQHGNRAVVPFLNGAGPSTPWSERSSRMAGVGVGGPVVVVVGFQSRGIEGGHAGLPAIPSRWCCMKPCGRPRLGRGREAIQFVNGTGGWVMASPGLHEVLLAVVTLLMPRSCWPSSGPGRRAARSRRPRASAGRRRPRRCCGVVPAAAHDPVLDGFDRGFALALDRLHRGPADQGVAPLLMWPRCTVLSDS